MKNLFNYILALGTLTLFLTSCTKEPEGLVDCASHRDSVANIRQDSDNSARFFGAWIASQSCDALPEPQNFQIVIEADMDNYPSGILLNNLEPEYSSVLTGVVRNDSIFIPESGFVNDQGDTLKIQAQGALAGENLSFSFNLQKTGTNPKECTVQATRVQ